MPKKNKISKDSRHNITFTKIALVVFVCSAIAGVSCIVVGLFQYHIDQQFKAHPATIEGSVTNKSIISGRYSFSNYFLTYSFYPPGKFFYTNTEQVPLRLFTTDKIGA